MTLWAHGPWDKIVLPRICLSVSSLAHAAFPFLLIYEARVGQNELTCRALVT
jgi:hypothetical protein